jgi:NADH-quinone oxidoreductase subunit N
MAMIGIGYLELLHATLPEILVAVAGLIAITVDILLSKRSTLQSRLFTASFIACSGCAAAIVLLARNPASIDLPGGMLVLNSVTALVQIALLALTILTLLLSTSFRFTPHVGEYFALLLFATVAMMFLVSTQNLLLIFIALEFLSLSLYILTGFDKRRRQSAEAALKYFLFGGTSAAFLLFGFSLLYGLANSLELRQIGNALGRTPSDPLLLIAIVQVAIGFGFKVAVAPFHFWAPDAYQGAPTASAGFIASSSKVASFFVFAQVFTIGLASAAGIGGWHGVTPGWVPVLTFLAALSMLWGNLAAIAQSSVRRLLAYSAIGHAGYMLLGLIAHTPQSLDALLYYVITYALASLGAFGVLSALDEQERRIDNIADLAGLSRRAPALAFCMAIFLLSLAGIPPLSGFLAKFYLFTTALNSASRFGIFWMVLLAIATSTISLYYYLRVLKQVYVADAPHPAPTIKTSRITMAALWIIAALVIMLGCAPNLLLHWIGWAMSSVTSP